MQFFEMDAGVHCDEIRAGRRDLLGSWGMSEQSTGQELFASYTDVLPHATYIGVSPAGSSELIGFTEYYPYAALSQGFDTPPVVHIFPLATISTPDRMANIRTIYLKQEYRRRFGLYVKLYATTALHAMARGLAYTTLSTWQGAHDVRPLYRRMGARLLSTFELAGFPPGLELYLIDLSTLIAQPFVRRFAAGLAAPCLPGPLCGQSSTSPHPGASDALRE